METAREIQRREFVLAVAPVRVRPDGVRIADDGVWEEEGSRSGFGCFGGGVGGDRRGVGGFGSTGTLTAAVAVVAAAVVGYVARCGNEVAVGLERLRLRLRIVEPDLSAEPKPQGGPTHIPCPWSINCY